MNAVNVCCPACGEALELRSHAVSPPDDGRKLMVGDEVTIQSIVLGMRGAAYASFSIPGSSQPMILRAAPGDAPGKNALVRGTVKGGMPGTVKVEFFRGEPPTMKCVRRWVDPKFLRLIRGEGR